jgi:FAD reductase [NAD(P)H]
MKLLAISGTIIGIKTSVLVQKILDELKQKHSDIEVEMLDLRDYNLQFCDGRKPTEYNEDTRKVIEKVSEADFYLIGTPIFNSSIPAPLKNLIDLIPPDVFRHKVMGFAANGGTYQHYLMIENQLKPIAGYLRAYVVPTFVYAQTSNYNDQNKICDEELVDHIRNFSDEIVYMQRCLGEKLATV